MKSRFAPVVPVSSKVTAVFGPWVGGPDAERLNIGCASNRLDGFLNLDMDSRVNPDVQWDLERIPLPFPDNWFDCVLASHVMEHIPRQSLFPLVRDIHRILKPGGHFIAVTPYATADGAIEAPQHVNYFTENTWAYFTDQLYNNKNSAGFGARENHEYADWENISIVMVPFPEFVNDPEIEWKRRHYRNVIQELHAVLHKRG